MRQPFALAVALAITAGIGHAQDITAEENYTGKLAVSTCYQDCFTDWFDRELRTSIPDGWRDRFRWCSDAVGTQFAIEQCAAHCGLVETRHGTKKGAVRQRYIVASRARRAVLEEAGLIPVEDSGFGEDSGGWSDACDGALWTTSPEGWSVYTGLPEKVRATVFRSDPDFQ